MTETKIHDHDQPMFLDETVEHYHVRECNNRIRVSISITPWTQTVFYERYVVDRATHRWEAIAGTTVAIGEWTSPMDVARRMYDAALKQFDKNGDVRR